MESRREIKSETNSERIGKSNTSDKEDHRENVNGTDMIREVTKGTY